MTRQRLAQFAFFTLILSILAGACSARPTAAPAATPSQPPAALEPAPVDYVYRNDEIGLSFRMPSGWQVAENDWQMVVASRSGLLEDPYGAAYQAGDASIIVGVASLEKQTLGNPVQVLDQYTQFANLENPDKEPAHMVSLGGKEFAIGTYSQGYIQSTNGFAPLFMAVLFTRQSTITLELRAFPGEDETRLRSLFESVLGSIENEPGTYLPYAVTPYEPRIHLTSNDLENWSESADSQQVDSEGVCRWFQHETLEDFVLQDCILYSADYPGPEALQDSFQREFDNSLIDLTASSKHAYDHEHTVFAVQDQNGLPVYVLLLVRDTLLFKVQLGTPEFPDDTQFEDGVRERFAREADDLLDAIVRANLAKAAFPFEPGTLISGSDLDGWTEEAGRGGGLTVYNDVICRTFTSDIDYGSSASPGIVYNRLTNCIFSKSENEGPAFLKDLYGNVPGSELIDLKPVSKYAYEYEYELFAHLSGTNPRYAVYLEKDGAIFNAALTTSGVQTGASFEEGVLEQFNNGIDDLLHLILQLNLERDDR